ncbi:MAG: hypothetical protein PUB89_05895 [Oscillospiraceae bacterium]|nr:hypothetical protein [Oscillospiraceae bacterium]
MSKLVKYDVATNFDNKIFDIIKEHDKDHRIKNLYGKLGNDGLPGGRTTAMVANLSTDQFADYVKKCNENNITFNYLINPLCMGQDELDPDKGKQIRDFIHTIYDTGVRWFTINSPSLIKYVKKEFKDAFVTLGLFAYPVTIQQVEYWRNWGVDEITLDHSFNRNFDLLRKMLTYYKDSDFALRLIANNFCLKECPYRLSHGGFAAHSDATKLSMDFSLVNCTYRKVKNPKAMLTSEWIRPEDVHYYEELAEETGNKNFSLKLVERTRPTPFIERVIKAYTSESYDGNLLDILNWPATKNITVGGRAVNTNPAGGPPAGVKDPPPGAPPMRFAERMDHTFLPKYGRTMSFPNIYIDNKKLDGFIEHFINNNNCANSLCAGTIIEDGRECSYACDYCGKWAEKVISYNKEEVDNWLSVASEVLSALQCGGMYK